MSHPDHNAELHELGLDEDFIAVLERSRVPRDEPVHPDLFSNLSEQIEHEKGVAATARALPTWQRAGLAVLLLALLALGTLLMTPRIDLDVYPVVRMWLGIALFGGGSLLTTVLALRPLHKPPLSRGLSLSILVAGAFLIPFGLAVMPQAHAAHAASLEGMGAQFLPRAMACFVFGLVLATPVIGAIWLLDRQGHATRIRALVAAVAAGLLGNLALQLHCPIVHQSHLIVGHALSLVATVALYFVIRSWLNRR